MFTPETRNSRKQKYCRAGRSISYVKHCPIDVHEYFIFVVEPRFLVKRQLNFSRILPRRRLQSAVSKEWNSWDADDVSAVIATARSVETTSTSIQRYNKYEAVLPFS